jgi:hypothetical protein
MYLLQLMKGQDLLKYTFSPLNHYTLFWSDLLVKSFARDRNVNNKKLTLEVDDLLDAPRVKAGIFTVNQTFLGKRFINKDLAIENVFI